MSIEKSNSESLIQSTAFKVWVALIVFTLVEVLLIFLLEPLLRVRFDPLDPDTGAADYYWTLNVRDTITMIITWTFYGAHQASVWIAIIWMNKKYRENQLNKKILLNYIIYMAIIMVGFSLLHLLQTHIWYDGLAQDVPIWTSQGSVIIMLSVLLVMQNSNRGIILGKKEKRLMRPEVAKTFMKSHQLIFSWALVYTFWFHPMDSSPALLSGFLYMGLLFTQMVLAYTRLHVNKWWVFFLEFYVSIHAVIVALAQWLDFGSNQMWQMFLLGFLAMVVFTYMHGLGLKNWVKWLIVVLYGVLMLFIYLPPPIGLNRGIEYLLRFEFLWIPIILYLIAFIAAGIAHLYLVKIRKTPQISK
jgi:hypothetical protein